MPQLSRLKSTATLSRTVFWIEWTNRLRPVLWFPLPRKELRILFVVQSMDRVHSWNLLVRNTLPHVVEDNYIRTCLLDKIYSYEEVSKRVLADVRHSTNRAERVNSGQLLRICRRVVAQLVLTKRMSIEDSNFHRKARSAALRALRLYSSSYFAVQK